MEERKYTFRKLNSTDLFPMIKIISKIGVDELSEVFDSDKIKALANETKGSDDASYKVGIGVILQIANKILSNLPRCEKEIFSLLANVSGMKVEEVKALDLDVFFEMIVEFISKEEFKSFFKVASKYIKA